MKPQTFFLSLLLLVLCFFDGFAQKKSSDSWATPANCGVTFSYLTVNDGLSSNSVRALIQDQYGFIWVGTDRGLNRWDGYDVSFYHNSNGMPITTLYETGDTIWIGTENGLFLYLQQLNSVCKYETKASKVNTSQLNISHITADRKGNIWIATIGQGMMKIDKKDGVVTQIPTPDNAVDYGFVLADSDGTVWATSGWTRSSLVLYDEKKGRFVPANLQFDSSESFFYPSIALTQGSDKHIWMATSSGAIVRFNPATLKASIVLSAEESGIHRPHSITEVRDGYFLIGSDSGLLLYCVSEHTMRLHTAATSQSGALSDNFVYPIITDREEGTWIGTYYGGVNYYHPTLSNFATHMPMPYQDSVSGNVINHFCEDKYGRIWIGSDDGGLSFYDPKNGQFQAVSLSNQATNNVHALCVMDDLLFVGTYGQGISLVDINTLSYTNIPYLLDDKGNRVDASSFEILIDAQSRVWVGTFDAICLFDVNTRTCRVMRQVHAPVGDMLQTRDGVLWFATESKGLWSYDSRSNKWRQYDGSSLCVETEGGRISVNSLYEDAVGNLFCGTSEGLLRYSKANNTFTKLPLPPNIRNVQSVTGRGDQLWLATNKGMCCYSVKNQRVEQVYNGGRIVTTDFLPGAICDSKSGIIYVGTTHGFVSFSPDAMRHNTCEPDVRFTSLEVLNKRIPVGGDILSQSLNHTKEITLSYRDNVIRISFAAMSFVQPSGNTYSYIMEGFDKQWIDAGNKHSVTYTNLEPGTYTFCVRANNNDGVSSPESTLRIVITPPFYWNTTAQIIYALLILLTIYYGTRQLMKRAEKRHKAEIEEIHVQKEQEIQEINTQKEHEIEEINTQKEQEIQEINTQKEQEVHEARIKFMTISPRDQDFLDRLEAAVEENFSNPDLSVDALATAVGISRTGMFTKLKALADVTPNEMIQVIRLKHAAALLQENRYRVSEVCYMVGFSSPSYFSKCFQKQYGVTPAKYV